VDTSVKRRRSWTVEAKRRITEESFEGKASVAEHIIRLNVLSRAFSLKSRERSAMLSRAHYDL
jgi:transposase-like protein